MEGNKMTQEEKRIKLAEAGGWKRIAADNVGSAAKLFYGDVWWRDAENNTIASAEQLPDYFNDLNAVHEFIVAQSCEFLIRYRNTLADFCGSQHYHNATAAQRAEAIGLTLELWEA
jgi:hypothetical protein